MKRLILPLLALTGYAASAQFSIQPQVGMETSRTAIRLNDLSSFAPEGIQVAPRLGVRMEYKVKTGHGAFLGFATGNSAIQYSFSDPVAARTIYKTSTGGLQLRLEGGYQFTSKKIPLGKAASSKQQAQASSTNKHMHGKPGHHFGRGEFKGFGGKHLKGFSGSEFRGFGGSEFRHGGGEKHHGSAQMRCGQRSSSNHHATASRMATKDDGLYMRIKPSAGIAFVPSASNGVMTNIKGGQPTYEYNTGINTAVIAGTAVEFGKGSKSKFVVSVNYLRSIGNNMQTLTTGTSAKPVVTTFSSRTSGFIVSMGLPLNLGKKPAPVVVAQKKQCYRQSSEGRCQRYRM